MDVNSSWSGVPGLGLPPQTQLLLEFLVVLMCLGAVTGNLLVIILVAATKSLRCVASVLVVNLAVSDLLVGVGAIPFVALSIMDRGWVDFTMLCVYVGFTSSVYCTASVLTLAAIALDRYHSIVDCLRYSSRCTLWRSCCVLLWIWLQALATSCPPLLGWSSVSYVAPVYSCAVSWPSSPSYTAFMATSSYLLPAAVILFCYVNIVRVARRHARRIHTLEDSLQRSRNGPPSSQQRGGVHSPSTLVYHVGGRLVSDVSTHTRSYGSSAVPESAAGLSPPPSGHVLSLPPPQHQNQHGVVRLFLVISAFFLCWTPYVTVALAQATESAWSVRTSPVPPCAVTLSHWLMLLNSDVNPLLYALLSKRFQAAFQGLTQRLRERLRSALGRGAEVRAEASDPCTLTSTQPALASSSDSSGNSESCSSASPVSAGVKHHSAEHACKPPSCPSWEAGDRRPDCLQVPAHPQEGSRLPFSAGTNESQSTLFYGQITVRVEHVG